MTAGAGDSGLDIEAVLSVLSRPDDADLGELVELASSMCDSRVALISVLDGERFHVPVARGIDPFDCPAEETFCRHTMSTDEVFCVEDASTDPRFDSIGFVDGRLARALFYASAPLYAPTGEMVGRLCVLDERPRTLTPLQLRALEGLALSVTKLIELRLLQAARVARLSPEVRQTAATLMFQLAAELSHDLRVPLTSITATLEMLQDDLGDHPDRGVRALLERAIGSTRRMERMLSQNLGFGAVLGHPTARDVDLQRVVDQLSLDSQPLLEQVGAVIEADQLPVVHADPDDMYSVLQNLVTNAVKFARPGQPARIRISSRRTGDGWRISVRDNGVGIPEERRVDVFSLFSRGETDVAGHGIGLATVHRIVTAHGGRVGADDSPEGGAELWFELPDGGTTDPADEAAGDQDPGNPQADPLPRSSRGHS